MRLTYMILLWICISGMIVFAAQDSNTIDFEDPFYAKVLRASIDDAYLTDKGVIPDYAKLSFQNAIRKEADLAGQKYAAMVSQWSEPNLLPSDYQMAALSILGHLELNEKRLLTFGLVIDTFGIPEAVYFNGYCSNENGTIPFEERFVALYSQKDIAFKFSAAGFCRAVHIYSSIANRNIIRWPQNYSYAEHIPILYNFSQDDSLYRALCEAIENAKHVKSSYYDWVSYMEKWPKTHKVPMAKYDLAVMLADHLLDNLAIVYLKITGQDTLYCGTWWKLEADNWVLLNDEQVASYFSELNISRRK